MKKGKEERFALHVYI